MLKRIRARVMRLGYLKLLLVGVAVLAVGVGSAPAGTTRHPTTLTLDASVDVGGGKWVDSGRMLTSGFWCSSRAIRLIGIREDGSRELLDWTLISIPGHAWATKARRTGFVKEKAVVRSTKRCKGDSVLVFPSPFPLERK